MEALLALSGLLAAAGIGAVGIGYARVRAGASPGVFAPLPPNSTIYYGNGKALGMTDASGTLAAFLGPAEAGDLLYNSPSARLPGNIVGVINSTGTGLDAAALATAQGSAVNQGGATQSSASANAQGSATAQGTNQANLDRELAAFTAAGFSLDDAEADIAAGTSLLVAENKRAHAQGTNLISQEFTGLLL